MRNATHQEFEDMKALVEQLAKDYKPCNCYIAVMPNSETGYYDLEIEVRPQAIIGGTFSTNTKTLEIARMLADKLEGILSSVNFNVFDSREAWESSVEE
jgi:hypothetical protein